MRLRNVAHFPCNYITYVKVNTDLLHNAFIYLLMLRNASTLTVGHLQGARKVFSMYAAFVSSYIARIFHIIIIIIITILEIGV